MSRPVAIDVSHLGKTYDKVRAVEDLSFQVYTGEIFGLLGPNGAGKSTTLRTIQGLMRPRQGTVLLNGVALEKLPTDQIVAQGVSQAPEGRQIFPRMTVLENLEMGAYQRKDKEGIQKDLNRVFELFPRLQERIKQAGGTLSGGEQQMLAIARAMMARPKVLMLDEPSMGLAPILVEQIFDIIKEINAQGTTILLVEQNAMMALSVATRGYVLEVGHIVMQGTADELSNNKQVQDTYLGVQ